MENSIFDAISIEAVQQALNRTDFEAGFEDGDEDSRNYWRAKTAARIFEASLRERGKLRDGHLEEYDNTVVHWGAGTSWKPCSEWPHENFPCIIIRIGDGS